jgi:hypothetical protein
VNVHVIAFPNCGDGTADVVAVFQNGVAGADFFQGDFVAEGNSVERFKRDRFVGLHDPAGEILAGPGIFDNHYANGVGFVVNNEMSFHLSVPLVKAKTKI